jgi:hypothetical protein
MNARKEEINENELMSENGKLTMCVLLRYFSNDEWRSWHSASPFTRCSEGEAFSTSSWD